MTNLHGLTTHRRWPMLPSLEQWQETFDTLHMWTQVVGKVRLSCAPWVNHSWGSALYLTTCGLTTSPIPYDDGTFAIDFDFTGHTLRLDTSGPDQRSLNLEPMTVAEFYDKTMGALDELGIEVDIFTRPVEVETAIPFEDDRTHASYDAKAVERFWRALVQADRVFKDFRSRFIGKASPVHFFWGAFDLAVTRFSGRPAPTHPGGVPHCADWVMQEAYSRELSSAGFWPGTGIGEAAFYSYAYPEPDGFGQRDVSPGEAGFSEEHGEFVVPYETVRRADDPDGTLMAFLESTYDAAATLADWDREGLERRDRGVLGGANEKS